MSASNKIKLPKNWDPDDEKLKKKINMEADKKNYVAIRQGSTVLLCGAVTRASDTDRCRNYAGMGTKHKGYGRCKYHGGNNTGPKTKKGKEKASKNSRVHGFYSDALMDEEADLYNEFLQNKDQILSLKHEITALRAKIVIYLKRWKSKFNTYYRERLKENEGDEPEAQAYAELNTRVCFSQKSDGGYSYYTAGTIEDNALDRALNTLARLIEKHARLTEDTPDDLVNNINIELRAASQGEVKTSWGTGPQTREK